MPITLAPTANFVTKTLNGTINSSVATITLSSTTNLQAPGVVIIDRVDSNGTSTPSLREIITYTGISGSDLTGCVRGAENSTASNHADGALVETAPTVGTWNSMATAIHQFADANGYIRPIASPASISILRVGTNLNISGASFIGFGITTPVWNAPQSFTASATILTPPLVMPRGGTFRYFTFVTKAATSGVSAIVDINKNGTSIFDSVGRPMIAAGGTFVSTASIKTPGFNAGDVFTIDYDGTAGFIADISVVGSAN